VNSAEQIAEGLSEAQKFWLLSGRQPSGMGKWPVQNALVDKGLAKTFPWQWTPLGLEVRAILERSKEG